MTKAWNYTDIVTGREWRRRTEFLPHPCRILYSPINEPTATWGVPSFTDLIDNEARASQAPSSFQCSTNLGSTVLAWHRSLYIHMHLICRSQQCVSLPPATSASPPPWNYLVPPSLPNIDDYLPVPTMCVIIPNHQFRSHEFKPFTI